MAGLGFLTDAYDVRLPGESGGSIRWATKQALDIRHQYRDTHAGDGVLARKSTRELPISHECVNLAGFDDWTGSFWHFSRHIRSAEDVRT